MANKIKKNSEILFELKNITKTFLGGKVIANNDVSIFFNKGEVHSLVGENGSGKSTLMNILFGLYKQDSGIIMFNGNEVNMYAPGATKKQKIGMVHQHFHLVDEFSILDNILIGQENPKADPELIDPIVNRLEVLIETQNKIYQDNLQDFDKSVFRNSLKIQSNIDKALNKIRKTEASIKEQERLLKRDLSNSKLNKLESDKQMNKIQIKLYKEDLSTFKKFLRDELIKSKNAAKLFKTEIEIVTLNKELQSYRITTLGFINKSKALKRFELIANKYNLNINPKTKVRHLSVGERQMVEIMKVLWEKKDVIVFDEPTATLSVNEIDYLLRTIKNLKEDGITIIFISHKLKEIKAISDQVTILRKGVKVGTYNNDSSLNVDKISKGMVGKNVQLKFPARKITGDTILSVEDLTYSTSTGFKAVNEVTFDINEGEIFGLAGIEGNGQEEVFNMIAGILKPNTGSITFDNEMWAGVNDNGKKVLLSLKERANKYSHSPIDRFKHGIVPEKSLRFNSVLSSFESPSNSKLFFNGSNKTPLAAKNEIIRLKKEIAFLKETKNNIEGKEYKVLNASIEKTKAKLAKLQQKYPGLNVIVDVKSTEDVTNNIIKTLKVDGAYENSIPIKNLSGGNQQKFVFGRELLKDHKLFLAGHPTRGLDIASIHNIYKKMLNNSKGKATLLYSLEINELMAVSDRIGIFYKGRLIDIVDPKKTSMEKISKLMIGVK